MEARNAEWWTAFYANNTAWLEKYWASYAAQNTDMPVSASQMSYIEATRSR